jgi:predicted TIM-barrel fold metal-dependent hydrolase
MLKIICIEEHAIDPAIGKAAGPALQREAPYLALSDTERAASAPRNAHRPTVVPMKKVGPLAADLRETRLAAMDEQAIQIQVVSWSSPVQMVPVNEAGALARAANDTLAKAIAENPSRLSGFAALPWQDPQAAADELSRAVTELGLKGALILGRPSDSFLDDPRYLPIFERLNTLKVPLYVHPFVPLPMVQKTYYSGFAPEVTAQFSLAGWGWHHESGIQIIRLILAGMFDRFPDLQIISGHWGEMVPFFLSRLDDMLPTSVTGLSRNISETYRSQVWVTPSGMFDLPQFEFIHKVLGPDRIIWSVDYPYVTLDGTREFLEALPVSDEDRQKIAHGNAERLLGL